MPSAPTPHAPDCAHAAGQQASSQTACPALQVIQSSTALPERATMQQQQVVRPRHAVRPQQVCMLGGGHLQLGWRHR